VIVFVLRETRPLNGDADGTATLTEHDPEEEPKPTLAAGHQPAAREVRRRKSDQSGIVIT
jgi:hypothetical protein